LKDNNEVMHPYIPIIVNNSPLLREDGQITYEGFDTPSALVSSSKNDKSDNFKTVGPFETRIGQTLFGDEVINKIESERREIEILVRPGIEHSNENKEKDNIRHN